MFQCDDDKLIATVQQFIETSPLGELRTRLRLLQAFHCHLIGDQTQDRAGEEDYRHRRMNQGGTVPPIFSGATENSGENLSQIQETFDRGMGGSCTKFGTIYGFSFDK